MNLTFYGREFGIGKGGKSASFENLRRTVARATLEMPRGCFKPPSNLLEFHDVPYR